MNKVMSKKRHIYAVAVFGVLAIALTIFFTVIYPLWPAKSALADDDIQNYIAGKYLESVGAEDVEVIYTYDPAYNCGTDISGEGGCFRVINPNIIYVTPGLRAEKLKYVLYHEYAHVVQFREGKPLDECEADKQAERWGAKTIFTAYDDC